MQWFCPCREFNKDRSEARLISVISVVITAAAEEAGNCFMSKSQNYLKLKVS